MGRGYDNINNSKYQKKKKKKASAYRVVTTCQAVF